MVRRTAIVDYGVGNLKSVTNAMHYLGLPAAVTGDPGELERADAILLPGVGAFPDAAEKLRTTGLDRVLLAQAGASPSSASAWGCSFSLTRARRSAPPRAWG